MKKIQKKRKHKIIETIDNNNLGSLSRTFLGSIIVVSLFYVLPLMINFANDNILITKEFKNNSKQVLAYTLDKKTNNTLDENEIFDERDLLVDIYNLNENETDAVRLDASTIQQLFEDTGYKLDDVRENKLVKPVALDSFPREIKMIENTKKRKELFLQIVLPLVLQENNNIKLLDKDLKNISDNYHQKSLYWDDIKYLIIYSKNENINNNIKAVIFYDSFLASTINLYTELFNEVYMIKSIFSAKFIEYINPDFVLEFRIERFLL